LASTYGVISANPASPVSDALPVVVSTSQGTAIIDSRVPHSDTSSAVSQPYSGVRRRAVVGSREPPGAVPVVIARPSWWSCPVAGRC
jgi:hypothetical protein